MATMGPPARTRPLEELLVSESLPDHPCRSALCCPPFKHWRYRGTHNVHLYLPASTRVQSTCMQEHVIHILTRLPHLHSRHEHIHPDPHSASSFQPAVIAISSSRSIITNITVTICTCPGSGFSLSSWFTSLRPARPLCSHVSNGNFSVRRSRIRHLLCFRSFASCIALEIPADGAWPARKPHYPSSCTLWRTTRRPSFPNCAASVGVNIPAETRCTAST